MSSEPRKLVLTKPFRKSYRKFLRKHPLEKSKVKSSLLKLTQSPFPVELKVHKLSGTLKGLFACSCGFDCRIVFSLKESDGEQLILLIAIGSHHEVY